MPTRDRFGEEVVLFVGRLLLFCAIGIGVGLPVFLLAALLAWGLR